MIHAVLYSTHGFTVPHFASLARLLAHFDTNMHTRCYIQHVSEYERSKSNCCFHFRFNLRARAKSIAAAVMPRHATFMHIVLQFLSNAKIQLLQCMHVACAVCCGGNGDDCCRQLGLDTVPRQRRKVVPRWNSSDFLIQSIYNNNNNNSM